MPLIDDSLHATSIFSDLDPSEIHRIAGLCEERAYQAADLIFVEHTEGNELFIILEGEVSIRLELASDDESMPLLTLGKGDVFGELSVVDDSPRSATARCISDARVLVLRKEDFDRLIETDHDLGFKVMRNVAKLVSRRVRATNQKILDNVSWGMI
jgi:CRP-like cAMP-binding protein